MFLPDSSIVGRSRINIRLSTYSLFPLLARHILPCAQRHSKIGSSRSGRLLFDVERGGACPRRMNFAASASFLWATVALTIDSHFLCLGWRVRSVYSLGLDAVNDGNALHFPSYMIFATFPIYRHLLSGRSARNWA